MKKLFLLLGFLVTLPYTGEAQMKADLCKASSSSPTYVNGRLGEQLCDTNGNLKQTLGTKLAGEDTPNDVLKVEQRFAYNNITTASTTVIKSSPAFLHCVVINTTAAGTITIYDNTSAAAPTVATIVASANPGSYCYDVSLANGLVVVTGAASNITVTYR